MKQKINIVNEEAGAGELPITDKEKNILAFAINHGWKITMMPNSPHMTLDFTERNRYCFERTEAPYESKDGKGRRNWFGKTITEAWNRVKKEDWSWPE